jgi:hypothetical protein
MLGQSISMKRTLAIVAAGLCTGFAVFGQAAPEKSWPHGPYDKVHPPKFAPTLTSPPSPTVRGAVVYSEFKTNAVESQKPRLELRVPAVTNSPPKPRLKLEAGE